MTDTLADRLAALLAKAPGGKWHKDTVDSPGTIYNENGYIVACNVSDEDDDLIIALANNAEAIIAALKPPELSDEELDREFVIATGGHEPGTASRRYGRSVLAAAFAKREGS